MAGYGWHRSQWVNKARFEECFDIALTVEKLSISELDMKDTSFYTTTEKFIVNKTGQI